MDQRDKQAFQEALELLVFKVTQVPPAMSASRATVDQEVVQGLQATSEHLVQQALLVQVEQLVLEVLRVALVRLVKLVRKAHKEMLAILDRLDSQDRLDHPVELDKAVFKDPEVLLVIRVHKVRQGSLDRLAYLVSLASLVMLVPRDCQDLRVRLVHLDNKDRVEILERQELQDSLDHQAIMEDLDHKDHPGLTALLDPRVLKDQTAR